MATKTSCPSESWDRYYADQESDPREEIVSEWIGKNIEVKQRSIKDPDGYNVRTHFHQKDGFPDDPFDVGEGVTAWLAKHPALFEVAYHLAKREEK